MPVPQENVTTLMRWLTAPDAAAEADRVADACMKLEKYLGYVECASFSAFSGRTGLAGRV
jgi:hypothetical protein